MSQDKDPSEDFELSFMFNDIELTRRDFGADLRARVASTIAWTNNIYPRDKAAALQLLHGAADQVILYAQAQLLEAMVALHEDWRCLPLPSTEPRINREAAIRTLHRRVASAIAAAQDVLGRIQLAEAAEDEDEDTED